MEVAIIAAVTLIALAAVLYPVFVRAAPQPLADLSADELDQEVSRYQEAIRRGTLCGRCLTANPPGSRYCADCGRPL